MIRSLVEAGLITGGGGSDRWSGGQGADRFEIANVAGSVTLIDFETDEGGVIDRSAFGIEDVAALAILTTPDGASDQSTLLGLGGNT